MTLRAITELFIFAYGIAFFHVAAVTLVSKNKTPVQLAYAYLAADFGLLCVTGSLGVHFHDQNVVLNLVSNIALAALGPLGSWFASVYLGDENRLRLEGVIGLAVLGVLGGALLRYLGFSWHFSFAAVYTTLAIGLSVTGVCLMKRLGSVAALPKPLKGFFLNYWAVILLVVLMLVGFLVNQQRFVDVLWLLCLLAMFVLTLVVSRHPELFQGMQSLAEDVRRSVSSRLKSNEVDSLVQHLQRAMETQRLFTKPNLRLEEVAEVLGISGPQLSELINRYLKLGFSQYINDLRIAEAQQMLKDSSTPVIEVALQCGFSSKTSFNRAFRTKTGLTPTDWRKPNSSS